MENQSHPPENSTQSFITVIPVDYPRSRVFPQTPEYPVGQYSEYMRGDYNINSGEQQHNEASPLYSVSQRFDRAHDSASQMPSSDSQMSDTRQSFLKMCVYLMSGTVVHMDMADGREATVQDLTQALLQEEDVGLPRSAAGVFTLWLSSPLLELQLKPHQKPLRLRQKWASLLAQYATASESKLERDEPILSFQRNVFFSRREEEKVKDQKILETLYEEARFNVIEGRYPCELSHYIMLGSIQACIQLGVYNPNVHTTHFFREHRSEYLPSHVCRSPWSWLRISGKDSPEVRLLEQYKRIPSVTPVRKLVRKYLEFCWSLPFYGAAFFQGQVEQPVRGLTSLITHQDVPVLIAINSYGVYVIDSAQCTLLLGYKYADLSWEFAKPAQMDNPDCLPCLFLQFMVLENGARVSKILQIFSKQAVMMDALISGFVEEAKQKPAATATDEVDRPIYDTSTDSDDTQVPLTTLNRREAQTQSCLSNKLSKLTLATFDEEAD